ncbi:MAG: transketolase C-terminal domain-containing protein [bacterium]|mgnify:CR=1 FL=1|nr:transketolase C-terminal domain-containing protein [bacterium]
MGLTLAETIKDITQKHLTEGGGYLLGQCVTAVGWIGGTVPDVKGIIEIPMTDVAAPGFAVGCALVGKRPIFVVRYQGFMYYNCSSIINYAARSKQVWGVPCPVFLRSIGMEGNGVGHTASSCLHTMFMHVPGLPVAAPITPGEYRQVWDWYMKHDDPIYVSEHRKSYGITEEMEDQYEEGAKITILAISASRMNALEAGKALRAKGIKHNLYHIRWLKPFEPTEKLLESLKNTKVGLVIDSDFELAGASQAFAYELMHKTGAKVYALGLEDRVCGVAPHCENITPNASRIAKKVEEILT